MIQKDTCIPVLTAALFTIAKTWKQTNVHQQMNRKRRRDTYINGILLSHIKKMPFIGIWMQLEIIILSEVSKTEKDKLSYDITYMWN